MNQLFEVEEKVELIEEVKQKEHKVSFEESFNYLLCGGEKVDFTPFVINHALSSEPKLLKYCSMFDYYMLKLDKELMQDIMHTLLPKTNSKYFKYLKRSTIEVPKQLKVEAEAMCISGRNLYQYYAMLFNQTKEEI